MKRTILKQVGYAVLMSGVLFLGACDDKNNDDPKPPSPPKPEETVSAKVQYQNEFAEFLMTNYYLWNNEAQQVITSQKLSTKTEKSPVKFYEKLVHQDDKWSFMTENVKSLNQEFSGTTTTFGHSLALGQFVDAASKPTGDLFAIVQFVYPNSPAEIAGLKRGDILLKINGENITTSNYTELFYATMPLEIGLGVRTEQGLSLKGGAPIAMTAVEMYEDPIIHHSVIEKGGKKIGYLFYTDYLLDVNPNDSQPLLDLANVFHGFQSAGVDEVILDLRYNGGGYALTSQYLCNLLAPRSALDRRDVMTIQKWNNILDREVGQATTYGHSVRRSAELEIPVSVNMNLSRLYVLTSSQTASASESTMVGLKPYLDLVQIGTNTSGKYCGGIVFDREIIDGAKAPEMWRALDNLGAYTMVYRFTNKNNDVFVNGFTPQYDGIRESVWELYPIGNENDPLLGKALELITGIPTESKSTKSTDNMTFMPIPNAPSKTNRLDGKMIDTRSLDRIREIQ